MHTSDKSNLPTSFSILFAILIFLAGCGENDNYEKTFVTIDLSELLAPSADTLPVGSLARYAQLWIDEESTDIFDITGRAYSETLYTGSGDKGVYIELYDADMERLLYTGQGSVRVPGDGTGAISIKVSPINHQIKAIFDAKTCNTPLTVCVDASDSYSTHFGDEGISYNWDWGDKSTTIDGNAVESHEYRNYGAYRIVLTVAEYHGAAKYHLDFEILDQDHDEITEYPEVKSISPPTGNISACEDWQFEVQFTIPVDTQSGQIGIAGVSGDITPRQGFSDTLVWTPDKILPTGKYYFVVESFSNRDGAEQQNDRSFPYSVGTTMEPDDVVIERGTGLMGKDTTIYAYFRELAFTEELLYDGILTTDGKRSSHLINAVRIQAKIIVEIEIIGQLIDGAEYRCLISASDAYGNPICLEITFRGIG